MIGDPSTSRAGVRDLATVLAGLAVINVVVVTVLEDPVAGLVQFAAALATVGLALRRGYTPDELAISPASARAGLRWGLAISAVVVVGVATIAALPLTRGFFDDDRFTDTSTWRLAYEVGVRIPVVTALSEELLFRSVLLAVLLAIATRTWAVLASSVCFGLWHVLVTLDDLGGNAATDSLGTAGRVAGVAGVVAATGVAGAMLAWSRLRSGSIVAPWLIHTSINGATFVAGYLVAVR